MVGLSKALSQRIGAILSASRDVWQVADRFRGELIGRDQLVVVGVNGIEPDQNSLDCNSSGFRRLTYCRRAPAYRPGEAAVVAFAFET